MVIVISDADRRGAVGERLHQHNIRTKIVMYTIQCTTLSTVDRIVANHWHRVFAYVIDDSVLSPASNENGCIAGVKMIPSQQPTSFHIVEIHSSHRVACFGNLFCLVNSREPIVRDNVSTFIPVSPSAARPPNGNHTDKCS